MEPADGVVEQEQHVALPARPGIGGRSVAVWEGQNERGTTQRYGFVAALEQTAQPDPAGCRDFQLQAKAPGFAVVDRDRAWIAE